MQVVKVCVRTMTTSREDDTKYEYFTSMQNARGAWHDLWMHHIPERALFEATQLAQFLGIKVTPLIINGEEVILDEIMKSMLSEDD